MRVGQVEGLTVKPTSHRAETATRTGIEVRVGEIESLAARPTSHRAEALFVPECVGTELNRQSPEGRLVYSQRGLPMPNRRKLLFASSTDGSRTFLVMSLTPFRSAV